ncbi:MAG: hypothetical protein U0797_26200 [Gemmataceae bacterium]
MAEDQEKPAGRTELVGWLAELHQLVRIWLARVGPPQEPTAQTPAYVDLIFSYGLARLGENDAARDLVARAQQALHGKDDAHTFLLSAYEYRVRQALDGKPHAGPLPDERMRELEIMERLQLYVVDRLRKQSEILEPDQRINPYRHWGARISDFEKALAELTDLTDLDELARRVDRLLAEVPKGPKGAEPRARVVRAGLEAAPRVGKDFARRMLDQAVPAYDGLPETEDLAALTERAALMEKALFVAGRFGLVEAVHPLASRLKGLLGAMKAPGHLDLLGRITSSCLGGLHRLGMRDEAGQLLGLAAEVALGGQGATTVDIKRRSGDLGAAALRAMLHVASGWLLLGRHGQAEPVMEAAWAKLLDDDSAAETLARKDKLTREESAELNMHARQTSAFARAAAVAPVASARARLEGVFTRLRGVKDTYTTASHFYVSQIDLAEAVVLAVTGRDAAASA